VDRRVEIPDGPGDRTEFRRDYSRLLHSPSFRRLQGKAQLFPASENDFFRNRLTHSLEVAQIGKSIAGILNEHVYEEPNLIDLDLVEFACLAHDLGHPPFGHIGEAALDRCMRSFGGFEGNAQSLRIVSCLEKKELFALPESATAFLGPIWRGLDRRSGLNVTYRAMASILKYDRPIPSVRPSDANLVKGYYYFDGPLIAEIRSRVLGVDAGTRVNLRTIECSIMDTADDIAYSTYDLEDVYKSGMHTPIGFWLLTRDDAVMAKIAQRVNDKIPQFYGAQSAQFTIAEARNIMEDFFLPWLQPDPAVDFRDSVYILANASQRIAQDGYARTEFTSGLISRALNSLELLKSSVHPAMDTVRLTLQMFKQVEVLKGLNFEAVIGSPVMKTIEHKGTRIIEELFASLSTPEGSRLLPDDCRSIYEAVTEPSMKKRVICDFIASMTDRYALQLHDRLLSTAPGSIYGPHI
jgi:dGTPase